MRRKFLSVVLCVCMMLTMVPFAFAEEGTEGQAPVSGGSTTEVSTAQELQNALNAATNGAVIKLKNDISLENKAIFSGQDMTVTLDLDTHTLTGPGNNYALDNSNNGQAGNGKLIVQNGTIQRATGATGSNSTVRNYGQMELNNVQLTGNYIVVKNEETATLTMNTCRLTAPNTYTSTENKIYITTGLQNWGTATATSCNITAGNAVLAASWMDKTGTSYNSNTTLINCTVQGNSNAISSGRSDKSAASQTISVTGGTYTGDVYSGSGSNITIGTQINGSLKVANDFSYTLGSAQYITSGPSKTTIGEGGSISGTINAAAKNGNTYYSTVTNAIEEASNSDTIELFQNTTEDVTVPSGRTVTLNLNGKKLTNVSSNTITNNGTLTIAGDGTVDNVTHQKAALYNKGTAIVEGGTFDRSKENGQTKAESGNNSWYTIKNVGTMTIKDGATVQTADNNNSLGKFSSLVSNGYFDSADFINNKCIDNPVLTIEGGLFCGGLNTIKNDDHANLTINNGTFSNYYQAVVQNHNVAEIKGGTFTAASDADSETYGVYNCGCAAETDLGTLTISGGTFTGATYAIVDVSKQSPTVSISGGNFAATKASIAKSTTSNATISVTGGHFTSDPTTYLATGYVAGSSDLTGYNYKVTQKTDTGAVEVKPAVAAPTVNADAIKTDDQTAVKNAAKSISVSTLGAAATDKAQNIDKDTAEKAVENMPTGTKLYVQSTLKVTPTAYDSNKKEFALEITPQYRIVASTAANADAIDSTSDTKVIQDYTDMSITQPTEVTMQLPVGFAKENDKLSIKHIKNGTAEYYTGIVTKDSENNLYLTFTTNGFSPFVISAAAAFIGDTAYPTFQEAVENVKNDETITLAQNVATDTVVTVARTVKFSIDTSRSSFAFDKDKNIVAGSNTTVNVTGTANPYTYDFTYTRPSSGGPGSSGGSISTPTTYAVNVNAATNGAVAADKKTASKGTTVTVTASPSKGYVVDAVKVVDKDGKDVAVTGKDGKYVFTMPASAVTVTGSFKAETPAPVALPFTDVKSGNWFYDAVKYAYAQGLMTGTSATTFAPNGTMNRAMIVTVLYRLEKSPAVTGASKFTDVPAGQWYSDAVAWAAANKIVNGYDETTFGPMNAVTREQMAAILFRYEQVKGLENVTLEENLNRFPDQNKISAYAIPALQWAVGQKIINGNANGTLDPTGTATRAQVAQIFTNLLNK